MHIKYPLVKKLAVYLKGQYAIYFLKDLIPEELTCKKEIAKSTFIKWFKYNIKHKDGCYLLYSEFL